MLTVDEARAEVLRACLPPVAERVDLVDAVGRFLLEAAVSDIDSPPHDKALMDGFAIRSKDVRQLPAALRVLETIPAGARPTLALDAGTAARIMTGAPLPPQADAVVMIEQTRCSGDRVEIVEGPPPQAEQNLLRRGAVMPAGEVVLDAGRRIRAVDIGLLAESGNTQVVVGRRPTVAILSTGDELVPCDQVPGPGQIRNSNSPLLMAIAEAAGGTPTALDSAGDDRESLTAALTRAFAHDVVVLSGGVSAGDKDLTPGVLAELGAEQIFHKLDLKPGKPLWFGRRPQPGGGINLVFGLPGNPVSSLVCFHLFVRAALLQMAGGTATPMASERAPLAVDWTFRGGRTTFFPGHVASFEDPPHRRITPLRWQGSADQRTLADANALVYFPPGNRDYRAGDSVRFERLDDV